MDPTGFAEIQRVDTRLERQQKVDEQLSGIADEQLRKTLSASAASGANTNEWPWPATIFRTLTQSPRPRQRRWRFADMIAGTDKEARSGDESAAALAAAVNGVAPQQIGFDEEFIEQFKRRRRFETAGVGDGALVAAADGVEKTDSAQKQLSAGDGLTALDESIHRQQSRQSAVQRIISNSKYESSLQDDQVDTFRSWIVLVGVFLALFCTFGFTSSFGIFQTYYSHHLLQDRSSSEISWVGTVQMFLIYFTGYPFGYFFDAGFMWVLTFLGIFLMTLALFSLSFATQYYQIFLSQAVCYGLGSGLLYSPLLALLAHWFVRYQAFAMGCAVAGCSFGGMIYPLMISHLMRKYSFPWTIRIVGFLNLGLLIVVLFCIKQKKYRRARKVRFLDKNSFKDLPFLLVILNSMLVILVLYVPYFYISVFAISKGINNNFATSLLVILNGMSLLGRLGASSVADRYGQINILMFANAFSAIVSFTWLSANSRIGTVLFTVFYGIFAGAYGAVASASVASLSKDLSIMGSRIGMLQISISLPALIGAPIAGIILKASDHKFIGLQMFTAFSISAALIVIVITRLILFKRNRTLRQ